MHKNGDLGFFAAVTCQDGRIHRATIKYIRKHYGDHYVDMITETGPNRVLAHAAANLKTGKIVGLVRELWRIFRIRSIRDRLTVSVRNHEAKIIFIVGHDHCAGNPAHRVTQESHLRQAKKKIESFYFRTSEGEKIPIVLLWVNADWITVEEIK